MEEHVTYQGRLFKIIENPVREFDGRERVYEYAWRADTIAVLITHPSRGVLLLHEVQPGGVEREASLVYGKVMRGEPPSTAAAREVREELGMRGSLSWLFSIQPCGKSIRWRIHQFILRGAEVYSPPQREPGERIHETWYTYDAFLSLLWKRRLDWETLQLGLIFLWKTYGRERLLAFLREDDRVLHDALRVFSRSLPHP